MALTPIRFGTDGWRAVIAEDFTFANVERVAQAAADYWITRPPEGTLPLAVVGYDRRFLSDAFAKRTAEVFAGNGLEVILTPTPTPTPAVSLAVREHHAVGGVMITASHNPPAFNGFKLKAWFGGAAAADICRGVESLLDRRPVTTIPFAEAKPQRLLSQIDLRVRHESVIKRFVDFKRIAKSGLRFAHDAMFGVGAGCFDRLLRGTTCKVTTLNGAHDPLFGGINPEPIAANYAASARFLRRDPHDLCLVTDGDADRIGGMTGRGDPISTHQLICLLARHQHVNRGLSGRVVKAINTTSMLDKMCAEWGLPLVETGIGFKHIGMEMLAGDVMLGAEESGSVGFLNHIPERDGILAGMLLLEMLAMEKRGIRSLLTALEKRYGPHRYARLDCRFPLEHRPALMEYCKQNPPSKLLRSPVVDVKTSDGVKFIAKDASWLMIRGSGTEPIVRIYAETSSDTGAKRLLIEGNKILTRSLGLAT